MKQCVLFLLIVLSSGWLYANHWTPVSGAYQNTATITGIVVIDDVEQRTNTLEVGAFCGDECRGSTMLRYLSAIDRYEVFLTIYGEDGNQITFKLYDHDAQQELDLNTPDPVAFVIDDIIGDPMDPYVFDFTSNGSQPQPTGVVIELNPGWNWISNLLTTETSLEEALANLTPANGDQIKSTSGFSTYNASTGLWTGGVNTFDPGRGYMYLNNSNQTTSFSYPTSQNNLPVVQLNTSTMIVSAHDALLPFTVLSVDDAPVIVYGVCWSTQPDPTIEGNHTFEGYGYGNFSSVLENLTANTTYYVRGYAATPHGLAYSEQTSFTTSPYPVTVFLVYSCEDCGNVSITVDGNTYTSYTQITLMEGQTCTLTATAQPGYSFDGWYIDGELVSTDATYSFTVYHTCHAMARFVSND